MTLHFNIDCEDDGRWIADVAELRGVLAYGSSRAAALAAAQSLALRVLADRLEAGELASDRLTRVHFAWAAA